jgi:catechol 2,3-dioxygenase-like lactoylglutathione lyase family enzyme
MTPRLDFVGLVVEDLERSLEFYRRLGLDPPSGDDHVEAKLPGGLRIGWDTVETIRSFEPDWEPPSGGQQIGLAFLVDSPAEVDALYAELSQAGHGHKEPWDAFWGQRYAQVKDPDGNVVDLFAPLES